MFSSRLPRNAVANALSRRVDALRAAGAAYVDLTASNPTQAGFERPDQLLHALSDPAALIYEPHPFGLERARAAVAADHARRWAAVDPNQVVLTTGTSEAYGWLFKLLCNPGDRVLVPRPSYPLFEHLTRLEAVEAVPYDLRYHGRWEIDMHGMRRAARPGARAVLVVTPNNPTGSYLKAPELTAVADLCVAHDAALIADEVFADYRLEAPPDSVTDVAVRTGALAFTLGGLSKSCGLPQLKLGWIVVGGAAETRRAALRGLELIADSYLSVGTPVQVAAPALLARGSGIRADIQARLAANLRELRAAVRGFPSCELLACEGGWYAVVRVPATRTEDELVLALLERERILVHPGYFFDFPHEAFLVVSLLPPPAIFAEAAARMLLFVTDAP